MSSPLGKNRGGTPRGVLLPQEQRRIARCGGWTLRLSAFRFLFLFLSSLRGATATKQSRNEDAELDCFANARNDGSHFFALR